MEALLCFPLGSSGTGPVASRPAARLHGYRQQSGKRRMTLGHARAGRLRNRLNQDHTIERGFADQKTTHPTQ